MAEQETLERARRDAEEGKSPSTQAGEFVREEMDHIREGKHGAKKVRERAARDTAKGRSRSRGSMKGLKKQGWSAASHSALSRFVEGAARRRSG